jgi:hypothetical protein
VVVGHLDDATEAGAHIDDPHEERVGLGVERGYLKETAEAEDENHRV